MTSNGPVVIVGAGISGAVLAERYASIGKKVLVIEKRDHIGGNCYDYIDSFDVRVSKYGAHLFHTNYEDVWMYVNQFSDWYFYEHKVLSKVGDLYVPVPVNITTVNMLFDQHITTETEMKSWLDRHVIPVKNPRNSEQSALSRVGPDLYKLLFRNYTIKQWDMHPSELDASVLERIPVRENYDNRYFSDKYQALPVNGYTSLFQNMLSNRRITVKLNTDYFDIKDKLPSFHKLFFTGPIDGYFSQHLGKLQYRSLKFEYESFEMNYFQQNSVINYPNEEDFTRIVEYKHFDRRDIPNTTISREYSTWVGEPYYPVPSDRNRSIYAMYQDQAKLLTKDNIYFVGRLANYKYFNMDQAFKNALDLFNQLEP